MTKTNWSQEHLILVGSDTVRLEGILDIPDDAQGIVLFAHGTGTSRHHPRNRAVAQTFHESGLATLLIDLLTPEEEQLDQRTQHLRFNIGLLATRLLDATDWLMHFPPTSHLHIGYFGAGAAAGAALVAAAERPDSIGAVVLRCGRPDLAGLALSRLRAPALFIVGEKDFSAIVLNREAMIHINAEKKFMTIPRATHAFEEPGALEEVTYQASLWFEHYLAPEAIMHMEGDVLEVAHH